MNNPSETTYIQPKKRTTTKILVIILIIISFVSGFFVGQIKTKNSPQITENNPNEEIGKVSNKKSIPDFLKKDVNFDLYWEVWDKIQNNFIDRPAGESKLLYGSLMGMVASLGDPYSVFLEPTTAESFQNELEGHFEGIGAEIAIKNNLLTVVSPLPDNPAERAGLKPKDVILQIDGFDTKGIDLSDAVNRIRGEKGTQVKLLIYREGVAEPFEVAVTRDTIQIVSVRFEMKDNGLAYIRVTNFHADTAARFKEAVNQTLLSNAKGIILDLRSNPGGYLDQAIDLSSYWVKSGDVVVTEKFSNENKTSHLANNDPVLNGIPTVVLINQGSASGSEILAGALKDHQLAKLVGKTTFGKGSVQRLEELSDGSALKLTIARWLTPNGTQIDGQGIAPDVDIDITEEEFGQDKDPQLDKAVEILLENQIQ